MLYLHNHCAWGLKRGRHQKIHHSHYKQKVSDGFFGGGPVLDPTRNGYASTASYNFFQVNNEINGTYQTKITPDISSTSQVGYSLQYEKSSYALLQGRGMAPLIQTVNGASTLLQGVDDRSEISISGYYVQQNFNYKSLFYLTAAIRVDGSSVFGKDQRIKNILKQVVAISSVNTISGEDRV